MTPLVRRLLASAALAVVVGACGGDGSATPSATQTGDVASPTAAPPETAPPASNDPSGAPSEDPTETPSEAPSDAPASDEPTPAPDPAAEACTGSNANRDFFAQVAGSVDWAVYCPVLPEGWFVEGGQYRLAGGSWLEVTYEGPGEARIELRQGAPCSTDGCVPTGTDLGAADYGDLGGTLLDLGGGRFAVVVDPGANPSWTLVSEGLAADDVRHIAAALTLVAN